MSKQQSFEHVYYISKDEKGYLDPIAIAPVLIDANRIEWGDTNRGVSLALKEIKLDGVPYNNQMTSNVKTISLITDHDKRIELSYLTLEIYQSEISKMVMAPPKFESTEALQKYYLENF